MLFRSEIISLDFEIVKDNDSKWFVAGVSIGDNLPYYDKGDVSFGIPDRWGAAAVVYGLLEGLVGVKDDGVAMDKITLAPRWASTDENEVSATVKYEASKGYLSYNYKKTEDEILILATSSSVDLCLRILMPEKKSVKKLVLNNEKVQYNLEKVENSTYLCLKVLNKFIIDLAISF